MPDHAIFMKRAMRLALKAEGKTSPNPLVGAVFVKGNKILADGYHRRAGSSHAEVEALEKLTSSQIRGGTLYVTLEPCAHFGRTPPCADYLIKKGVKKVAIGMLDPNPRVAGKGIKKLRAAGIAVEVGILEAKVQSMNESYSFAIRHRRPFVIIKMACTLDGKIATKKGDSKWISDEISRKKVHRLRKAVDAVLTSSKTILADNPHLGVRWTKGRDPKRIILDSKLKTPLESHVYRNHDVIVAALHSAPAKAKKKIVSSGIELLLYRGKKIPLRELLSDLYKKGINSILVEAGSGIATAFLREKLAQKIHIFIAPKILGEGKSLAGDLNIVTMNQAMGFQKISWKKLKRDIEFIGYI